MRYFKDDKDGYYVVANDEVSIPDNWVQIAEAEYFAANPDYKP